MIFGFNTDVKHGDTVYHVQTEAHPSSHTFQSTVFVKGKCIGKKSGSYVETEQTDEQLHQLLKDQHRYVVEAIRDGLVEEVLSQNGSPGQPASDFL